MFDFQQKRKLRTAFESRITWGILLLCATLVLISAYDRFLIARDMAERRAVAEQDFKELEERKASLESEVEYLSHERGMEAEMRRQFDVVREGEQIVIILEDEATTTEPMPEAVPAERPWYRFW
jgi:cell division protein FtsB